MNAARLLRGAARVVFGLASLAALVVFVIAALADHTATASAAAGLCLALAILAALDLESFEGLGIKAKLRTTLSDAEARLNSLDAVIRSLARGSFVQIARGHMSDQERRTAVDELTLALQAADVSEEMINSFKKPFYAYISGRCWYTATLVQAVYAAAQARALEARERRLPDGEERNALRAEKERFTVNISIPGPYGDDFEQFRAIAQRLAAEAPIATPEHRQIFFSIMNEISDTFEECLQRGTLTDRVIATMGTDHFARTLAERFQYVTSDNQQTARRL